MSSRLSKNDRILASRGVEIIWNASINPPSSGIHTQRNLARLLGLTYKRGGQEFINPRINRIATEIRRLTPIKHPGYILETDMTGNWGTYLIVEDLSDGGYNNEIGNFDTMFTKGERFLSTVGASSNATPRDALAAKIIAEAFANAKAVLELS